MGGGFSSLEVPDFYATVRNDNNAVLGVAGKDYQIVQNVDAFSFFDAIIGGGGIHYETAGALGKGGRVFITAKQPGYIRVGREDLIEQYVFVATSHNGTGSITAAFTPDEPDNWVYGEAVYKDGVLKDAWLQPEDFESFDMTEEEGQEGWLFGGRLYESDYEIKDVLLDRRKASAAEV